MEEKVNVGKIKRRREKLNGERKTARRITRKIMRKITKKITRNIIWKITRKTKKSREAK